MSTPERHTAKSVISLRLGAEMLARIDKLRDGSRSRFIEDAIVEKLDQIENSPTAVEHAPGTNPQSSVTHLPPRQRPTAHRHLSTCRCPVCKPPKQAA